MAPRRRRSVNITVDADDAKDRMGDILDRGENLKPVFRWAEGELEKANSRNFGTGGLPVGNWKRLDADYGAWKAANFPGAPKMFRTGRLFRSLTNFSTRGISLITDTHAEFGTDVEYAKFHQYGTTKMPKRKIVYTPRDFARDFGNKAVEFIANGRVRI